MGSETSVARATKKWPQAYHYAIINNALVNAYVIYLYNMKTHQPGKPILSRFKFNIEVALRLTKDLKNERYQNPEKLSHELRANLKKNLKIEDTDSESNLYLNNRLPSRVRCHKCIGDKRQTQLACMVCRAPICHEHQITICKDCKN